MRALSLSVQGMGLALAALVASPAWGQVAPAAADNPQRTAVFTYEMALRGAVLSGGQKLAREASSVVPEAVLNVAEQPIVRGYPLEGYGFFFDVQAPNIQTTVMVLDMYTQMRRGRPLSSGGPEDATRPVADRQVAATGTVEPDPMTDSLAMPGGADRAYSNYVKAALIDALLDSSAVLPLTPENRLTVAAGGIDPPGANPLYQSRKLLLTITGADVMAFRQGRLTREEAKARIVEGRF